MDSPLRLIALTPVDRLAKTVEALLVVAGSPLSIDELAEATEDHPERIETAIELLRERYAEGRSGIVLEAVAGGFAFRASRDAARDRCKDQYGHQQGAAVAPRRRRKLGAAIGLLARVGRKNTIEPSLAEVPS